MKNFNTRRLIIILFPISFTLMHFTLFRFFRFEFTTLFISLNILAISSIMNLRLKYKDIFLVSFLFFLPFINILTRDFDLIDFIRSLLLYINTILIVVILKNKIFSSRDYHRLFNLIINFGIIASVFLIVQVIHTNVTDSKLLYYPFKTFTFFGGSRDFYYDTSNFLGVRRGNGFFIEPSVAGWFNCVIFTIILTLPDLRIKLKKIKLFIVFAGIISSLSASAFVNLIAILTLYYMNKIKYLSNKLLSIPVFVISIYLAFYYLGVIERLKQITVLGSSTYYRFMAPYKLLLNVLKESIFGMPFGSSDSINNSYYLLSYSFGVIGIILCSLFILYSIYAALSNKEGSIFLFLIVLILAGTGSTYTPEIGAIILIYYWQIGYLKYHYSKFGLLISPRG